MLVEGRKEGEKGTERRRGKKRRQEERGERERMRVRSRAKRSKRSIFILILKCVLKSHGLTWGLFVSLSHVDRYVLLITAPN